MEEIKKYLHSPGDFLTVKGEKIYTSEGYMTGNVTVRISACDDHVTWAEIVQVDKPEWEWTLNHGISFLAHNSSIFLL